VGYIFPELEHYFTDILAKSMMIILENCPFPSEIRRMGRSRFVFLLAKENPRFSRKRAEEIYELACSSVGITGEEKSALFEIKFLLKELEDLKKNMDKVNAEVQNIVSGRDDYSLLISIPGVGPVTASSVIAEIEDITNFSLGKQLIKLAGLDLYGSESGISITP